MGQASFPALFGDFVRKFPEGGGGAVRGADEEVLRELWDFR